MQGGQDLSRREHTDGSRDHVGAMFAVGGANGRVTHIDGTTGKNNFAAYSFGRYWTHFYLDTVAIGTYYDMTSSANRGIAALNPRGTGLTASTEVGRPIRFAEGYFIEPQAQASARQPRADERRRGDHQFQKRRVSGGQGRRTLRPQLEHR
jgi:outer membrane autotransporter protein